MKAQSVAVVIPAYNAQATLAGTLMSVRQQTYRDTEIIVVDDGSKDGTRALADRIAADDPRIHVISQANAGVAAARNTGWQSTGADLIAFVDADDLWAPAKLEKQIAALGAAGDGAGLVYTWYAMIDKDDYVIYRSDEIYYDGDVLDKLFEDNFVGNGSSPLVRRKLLIEVDGFESSLRNNDAQGCEDLMLYCRVAERAGFAVVPEYLVGYRQTAENMSADLPRMLRSWLLVVDEMIGRHPDKAEHLRRGMRRCGRWLAQRAVESGRTNLLMPLARTMARRDVRIAARMLAVDATAAFARPLARKWLPHRHDATSVQPRDQSFALGTRYDAGWGAPAELTAHSSSAAKDAAPISP